MTLHQPIAAPITPAKTLPAGIATAREQLESHMARMRAHTPLDLVGEESRLTVAYEDEQRRRMLLMAAEVAGLTLASAIAWWLATPPSWGPIAVASLVSLGTVSRAAHFVSSWRHRDQIKDVARLRATHSVMAREASDEQYIQMREIRKRRPQVSLILANWMLWGGRRLREDAQMVIDADRLAVELETLEAAHLDLSPASATDTGTPPAPLLLTTVAELMACLREAPKHRVVFGSSSEHLHSYVRHGSSDCVALVAKGSPAAGMLNDVLRASDDAEFEPHLLSTLPVRVGPCRGTWALTEHPQARKTVADTWAASSGVAA